MSIEFRCPECQEMVHVGEALVGLHTRCPRCSANIAVPDSSPEAYKPTASSPPATVAPRSWEPPSSRYSDYEAPVRYAAAGWDMARYGLTMEFIGVGILICTVIGSILIQCVAFGGIGGRMGGMGGGPGMGMLMVALSFLILGAFILSVILIVIGRFMCCAAPSTGGLKGLAIASAASFLLSLLASVAAVLMLGVGIANAFGGRGGGDAPAAMGGVLGFGALLLLVTAHILYMIFLRNAAVSLGNRDLGTRCVVFLVFSLVLPVLYVLGAIFLVIMAQRGDPAGPMMFLQVGQWVLTLVLLGWYSNLLGQVRDTVTQGGRSRGGDWR